MEKKPILDIMVDLETASTKENAAILSWAMVPFDRQGKRWGFENFYKTVNLTSCFMAGMDIEKGTQLWWEGQTPEARAAVMKSEGENILSVTSAAYCWLSALAEKNDLYMWCRGIDFDIPKMEWCFRKFVEKGTGDEDFPYKYSHKMDVRTVLKFMQIDPSQFEFEGIRHHSVDDCNHDIKMVQKAYGFQNGNPDATAVAKTPQAADCFKVGRKNADVQEIRKVVPIAFCNLADDKGLGFSWVQIDAINRTIRNWKDLYSELKAENEDLARQLQKLQAKG